MKSVERRISRLEERFAPNQDEEPSLIVVVNRADRELALDNDACVQILREADRWMRGQILPAAALPSLNFFTGVTPARLFQMATSRSPGHDAANAASSSSLVKLSKDAGVLAAASSVVANATISFCSLMVKVVIIVSPLVPRSAVHTSITRIHLKSKAIVKEIDRGAKGWRWSGLVSTLRQPALGWG